MKRTSVTVVSGLAVLALTVLLPTSAPRALADTGSSGADVPVGNVRFTEHVAFVRLHMPEGIGGPAKEAGKGGWGFCVTDKEGNFFLADPQNCQIHWVDKVGTDHIVAGDGNKGLRDGPGDQARFDFGVRGYNDVALRCDDAGNVYVSDGLNARLRKLHQKEDGSWWVTTVSGGGTKYPEKGKWVPALELAEGCATRFAVTQDGSAAYYCGNRGIYKVLLKEGKATLLATGDELRTAGIKSPSSWHVGGAHITPDKVFYWMPGGSKIYRYHEKTGKVELFAGSGPVRSDGTGLLDSGFHTVHTAHSPSASVIYTGGGDEWSCRRIYGGKVMHLLKDGTFARREGTGHKRDQWQFGTVMWLDLKGRLYTIPAPYSWPGWITRATIAKEAN